MRTLLLSFALAVFSAPLFAQSPGISDFVMVWARIGGRYRLLEVEGAQIDTTLGRVRLGSPAQTSW